MNVPYNRILFCLLLLCHYISSEEVCSFRYMDVPEPLNGKTLSINSKSVAMDRFISVGDSSSNSTGSGIASVFFIIDNSQSMYNMMGTDIPGERFEVPNALIDSFYKANPHIEVGCAIFQKELVFDPTSDDIIEGLSTDSYGYLPLMKLGSQYNSSELGNRSGYDILKHYLDYDVSTTVVGPMGVLKYKNDAVDPKGTNINSGFNAAKAAFKTASYPKGKQFIIFISDGLQEGGTDDYLQGANTPTTFTIYMAKSASFPPPQKLQDMTAKIQSNSYSITNPKSVIKLIKTGTQSVLDWTLDNVIDIIYDSYDFTPEKLEANNIINSNWADGGFTYDELFPLIGQSTDFTYNINYTMYHNEVKKGDTTVTVEFDAELSTGTLSDSISYLFWGRNLEFYSGGSKISSVTADMAELEIRFTPYKVDTFYDYTNVSVELRSTSGDLEKLKLDNKGSYFSATINREIGATSSSDGILQHSPSDEFTALFKNQKLPLDTLLVTIPFEKGADGSLNSATYFDRNADGKVDSIVLHTTDCDLVENAQEIVDALHLPPYREFDLLSYTSSGDKLSLSVYEKRSAISTNVTNADTIILQKALILKNGSSLPATTLSAIDSVAPVVLSATLVDSVKEGAEDYLTVTFSETVKTITHQEPFHFYAQPDFKTYEVTLTSENHNGTEVQFLVESINGTDQIIDGDSLNIVSTTGDVVSDDLQNNQDNNKNRRCEIEVIIIDNNISIREATYFDNNADGYVDSLYLEVPGVNISPMLTQFVDALTLPSGRSFTIVDYDLENMGVGLTLKENSSTINTAVLSEDKLIVTEKTQLGEGQILKSCTLSIVDSIAPVVLKASLVDSVKSGALDLLTVEFSEEIQNITNRKPLSFVANSSAKKYSVELSIIEEKPKVITYAVETVSEVDKIGQGDSLWINATLSTPIGDIQNNKQDNENNRRCEISVETVEEGLILQRAAYFDNSADGLIDSIFIAVKGDKVNENIDLIIDAIELPKWRKLEILDYAYDKGLTFSVRQDFDNSDAFTGTTSKDIITVPQTELNDGLLLLSSEIAIEDSMAPVLLSASALDSTVILQKGAEKFVADSLSRRTLTVQFSEPVQDIILEIPFYLFHQSNQYEAKLSLSTSDNGLFTFDVFEVKGEDRIVDGDSIHINWEESGNIGDTLHNWQRSEFNIKREIELTYKEVIKLAPAHIDWELKATLLKQHAEDEIDQQMYFTLSPKDKNSFTTMDSLEAQLTLIDPTGNTIFTNRSFEYKSEGTYLYIWDGKNRNSRITGSGSFIALVEGYRHFNSSEKLIESIQFKKAVGVQK